MIKVGIKYRKLSVQEVSNLVRFNRVRKIIKKIDIKDLIKQLKTSKTGKQIVLYTPRNDQSIIINDSYYCCYFIITIKFYWVII